MCKHGESTLLIQGCKRFALSQGSQLSLYKPCYVKQSLFNSKPIWRFIDSIKKESLY